MAGHRRREAKTNKSFKNVLPLIFHYSSANTSNNRTMLRPRGRGGDGDLTDTFGRQFSGTPNISGVISGTDEEGLCGERGRTFSLTLTMSGFT